MKHIVKVWKNKLNNQKLATIPQKCDIEDGDYIEIKQIKQK